MGHELALADRVKETSSTEGTDDLTFDGSPPGFQTFLDQIPDGYNTFYTIEDANGSAWEVGRGVWDEASEELARTEILDSSTGSKIELSSGSHTVFCGLPASKAITTSATYDAIRFPGGLLNQTHYVNAADYTVAQGTHTVYVNAGATDRTITLPPSGNFNFGQEFIIKKIDSGVGRVKVIGVEPTVHGWIDGAFGGVTLDQKNDYLQVQGFYDAAVTYGWHVTGEKITPHMAKMTYVADNQAIPSNTLTQLEFDTVEYDVGGLLTSGTGSDDYITIQRDGKYLVTHSVLAEPTLDLGNYFSVKLFLNGTTEYSGVDPGNEYWGATSSISPATNRWTEVNAALVFEFAKDDVLRWMIKQNSGSTHYINSEGSSSGTTGRPAWNPYACITEIRR